jgi:hypothetical protein
LLYTLLYTKMKPTAGAFSCQQLVKILPQVHSSGMVYSVRCALRFWNFTPRVHRFIIA